MVILAAVDGEQTPDDVVRIGHDLASAHDEELVVLHVMHQNIYDKRRKEADKSEGTFSGPHLAPELRYRSADSPGSEFTIEDAEQDAAAVAQGVVEQTLDQWSGVTTAGSVGEVTKQVLMEASSREARYIVVSGRKRSPVGKAIFGSIAQSILLNSNIPVVTIRGERT